MASEVQTEQPRLQPTKLSAAVNPIREVNICKHNLMSLHSSTSMVPTFRPFVGPLKRNMMDKYNQEVTDQKRNI